MKYKDEEKRQRGIRRDAILAVPLYPAERDRIERATALDAGEGTRAVAAARAALKDWADRVLAAHGQQ